MVAVIQLVSLSPYLHTTDQTCMSPIIIIPRLVHDSSYSDFVGNNVTPIIWSQ